MPFVASLKALSLSLLGNRYYEELKQSQTENFLTARNCRKYKLEKITTPGSLDALIEA